MRTDEITEESTPEQPAQTGPGELLGRQREALGLGIPQVAEDLHITMHYVRALESNAFDKLPGDVFVRGYLRAYANLLHLDPQDIIGLYDAQTQHSRGQEEQAYQSLAQTRSDRNLPWVLISGAAFVVIAMLLWFFAGGDGEDSVAPNASQGRTSGNGGGVAAATLDSLERDLAANPAALFEAPAPRTSSSAAVGVVGGATASEPLAAGEQPSANEASSAGEEPSVNAEPTVNAESAAGEEPASDREYSAETASTAEQPSQSASQQGADVARQTADQPAPAPAAPEQPATADTEVLSGQLISIDAEGSDVLQMIFKGDSRVAVDDGRDQQIYEDSRDAGDVLRITGAAPFDIFLENAGSVELRFNGHAVDFRTSIRSDNSARLTIGL